jgi:F-type H+-transporting ATPase subunit epsilon
MKLVVSTPFAVVIDADDVTHVRAEDSTGSFGLLQGHADFITALDVSVLSWHKADGAEHYVALRGGMLEVRGGDSVAVATSEAVPGDDLHRLESEALERFRRRADDERAARVDAERLHVAAIRQIIRLLRPQPVPSMLGRTAPNRREIEP